MGVRSLHIKLLIPLATTIVVSSLIVTFLGTSYEDRIVSAVASQRARSLATLVQHEISRAMLSGDPRKMQWIIDDLAQNADIAGVRVLDPQGNVRWSTRQSELGTAMMDHIDAPNGATPVNSNPGALHFSEPLANRPQCRRCHTPEQRIIGVLDLDVDVTAQRAGIKAWHVVNFTLTGVQLFAIGSLAFPILGALVVRPIRRLAVAMERVQRGDFDVSVEPVGTREIDGLSAGFNSMVVRLRDAARLEQEAQQMRLERAEQLAAVGELAVGLAHEIRNPLSAVKAAIEVLADELPAGNRRGDVLRESAQELARIDHVTRDLMQYAKPRQPTLERVDLNDIVRDAAVLAQAQAAKQGASIVTDLDADPAVVLGDRAMIRQVIVNLLLNGLQALNGTAGGRVTVATARQGHLVIGRVRDTGGGVQTDRAESVFKPFFTTKARGTGLGLATSRRLIELHGGRLRLENPGQPGACFAFVMPTAEGEGSAC